MPVMCLTSRCLITSKWCHAFLLLLATTTAGSAQKIATLDLALDRPSAGIQVPVQLMLDPVTNAPDSVLQLVELRGKRRIPVAFQIAPGTERMMTWIAADDRETRTYELLKGKASESGGPSVQALKENGALTLKHGGQPLLQYHYEAVYPPKGVDSVFRRSAFIHPLWSPHGQVLTRIQPPDHHHHYGLWNPWTHVLFEGDTVDFWNLGSRQGTVRFADFVSLSSGDVYGEFAALHEHVAFGQGADEQVALLELQTVRVYAPEESNDYYIADITVKLRCPDSPVRLLEYRYGGMGWRATEAWTKDNSRVLSSEGKTRKNADGSRARWCIVEGTVDGQNAGAVMMSYPLNYNYPEPLRIWPENANGNRGDMFANFSPTKDRDWQLKPGNDYVLRYRFIVFNGSFPKEKAEAAWHYFAAPPLVKVKKETN